MNYAVVPFRPRIKEGEALKQVAAQLQELIQSNAANGWEYVRLEQITVSVNPGCLASAFGAKAYPVTYQVVVFRAP